MIAEASVTIIDHLAHRIARWTRSYFSASAVVWAVADGRRPDPDAIRRAGLDPWAFVGMGHG